MGPSLGAVPAPPHVLLDGEAELAARLLAQHLLLLVVLALLLALLLGLCVPVARFFVDLALLFVSDTYRYAISAPCTYTPLDLFTVHVRVHVCRSGSQF